jgi:YVTN family beta-propeller protein
MDRPAGVLEDDVMLMGITVRGGSGATTRPNDAFFGSLNIGGNPRFPIVSPDGTYIAATNNSTSVWIIRTTDFVTDQTLTVTGAQGREMCWLPNGTKIYRNTNGLTVDVITVSGWTDASIASTYSGAASYPLLPSPDSAFVYQLVDNTDFKVIRTSDDTVVATVTSMEGDMRSGAWTSDSAFCYISCYETTGKVDKVRSSDHTRVASITVGSFPRATVILPDDSYVYTANRSGNTVSAIRTSDDTVQATIAVSTAPAEMVVTSDGAYIYVGHDGTAEVKKIRTSDRTVVATITMSEVNMSSMVISADDAYVYVMGNDGINNYTLMVIQTSSDTEIAAYALSTDHSGDVMVGHPTRPQLFMADNTLNVRGMTTHAWEQVGSTVNSGTDLQQSVWHRVADGDEALKYGVAFDASRLASGAIIAVDGAALTIPSGSAVAGQANASSTSVTAPSTSFSEHDGIDVGFFGTAYGTTFTPPTNYTEPTNGEDKSTGTTLATATEVAYRLLDDVSSVGSIVATAVDAAVNIGHHVWLDDDIIPSFPTPVHLIGSGL